MFVEKVLYHTWVTAIGGRDIGVLSCDGVLDLKLTTPRELGGADGGGTIADEGSSVVCEDSHRPRHFDGSLRGDMNCIETVIFPLALLTGAASAQAAPPAHPIRQADQPRSAGVP
jgi:hypothetical protein